MEFPGMRSPRKSSELQGPRPTPLKINKESHKIKKPPLPPPQLPPRQPIIIYTVSPKIIHTTPSDFMSLVQRLTGSHPSSSSSHNNNSDDDPFSVANGSDGARVSPAARFASMEKARSSPKNNKLQNSNADDLVVSEGTTEIINGTMMTSTSHGILSPGPTSLSPIPSSFFSQPPPSTSDPGVVSLFHDLSPVLHSSRNFMESGFIPSPSNYFVSPRTIDLFHTLFN